MKKITGEDFLIGPGEIEAALFSIFNTIINRVGSNVVIMGITNGATLSMSLFNKFAEEMPNQKQKPMLSTIGASRYAGDVPKESMSISNIPSLHLTSKKKVVLFDDVIDSGVTIKTVAKFLGEQRGAKEVIASSLCVKGDLPFWLDESFVGFQLPKDKFIVGFGMDYHDEIRNEMSIRPIRPEEKERIDKKHAPPMEDKPPKDVKVDK